MSQCHASILSDNPHPATGWLVSPSGRRVAPMCARHANRAIIRAEFEIGEHWWFEPVHEIDMKVEQ